MEKDKIKGIWYSSFLDEETPVNISFDSELDKVYIDMTYPNRDKAHYDTLTIELNDFINSIQKILPPINIPEEDKELTEKDKEDLLKSAKEVKENSFKEKLKRLHKEW